MTRKIETLMRDAPGNLRDMPAYFDTLDEDDYFRCMVACITEIMVDEDTSLDIIGLNFTLCYIRDRARGTRRFTEFPPGACQNNNA